MKPYKRKVAIGIVAILVLGAMVGLAGNVNNNPATITPEKKDIININQEGGGNEEEIYYPYDSYVIKDPDSETSLLAEEQNDMGYNTDTGNNILKALPIYPCLLYTSPSPRD